MARTLHIGLSLDALSVGVDVPLQGVEDWWKELRERNARQRALEDGQAEVPRVQYYDRCPSCGAGITSLTTIDDQHACRKCGHAWGS
jgi:ribosomal protein S27AE